MLSLLATASDSVNTAYLWVWIGIGVVTFIGFGITAAKWLRQQGAAEERLNGRLDDIENRQKKLEKQIQPNGLDTDQLGDMVKRTENAISRLNQRLSEHIGEERESRKQIWQVIQDRMK